MEAETRRVLDILDEALSKHDRASRELATIISAARGPDNEHHLAKEATMVVRMQAFPKSCNSGASSYNLPVPLTHNLCWSTLPSIPEVLSRIKEGTSHFKMHVTMALEVLGWQMYFTEEGGEVWKQKPRQQEDPTMTGAHDG